VRETKESGKKRRRKRNDNINNFKGMLHFSLKIMPCLSECRIYSEEEFTMEKRGEK
jgi:hypothetical protein